MCDGRQGVLVGDVSLAPTLSVLLQRKQPAAEPSHQRPSLASSCSASTSSHEAHHSVTAGSTAADETAAATERPQTLAECQDFIRRLEADSVKQAHEVNCKADVRRSIKLANFWGGV